MQPWDEPIISAVFVSDFQESNQWNYNTIKEKPAAKIQLPQNPKSRTIILLTNIDLFSISIDFQS